MRYIQTIVGVFFSSLYVCGLINTEIVLNAGMVMYQSQSSVLMQPVKQNDDIKKVESYLESKGSYELAQYASEIVKLPRWKEALAIIGKETSFCKAGVGKSKNNCGAIRSSISGRGFKVYENVFDSVWDVSYLLTKPRYAQLSIAEMNGIYCVDETNGGVCPLWTEHIEWYISEINEMLLTG